MSKSSWFKKKKTTTSGKHINNTSHLYGILPFASCPLWFAGLLAPWFSAWLMQSPLFSATAILWITVPRRHLKNILNETTGDFQSDYFFLNLCVCVHVCKNDREICFKVYSNILNQSEKFFIIHLLPSSLKRRADSFVSFDLSFIAFLAGSL